MSNDITAKIQAYLELQKELGGDELYTQLARQELNSGILMASKKDSPKSSFDPNYGINEEKKIKIDDWSNSGSLDELLKAINQCKNCPLGYTRTKFVFGKGNPNADIMIIGEAPGADEDAQGEPFVGRAGQLLTKILEAINLSRDDVFIANILKCRPPNNRNPLPAEINECEPYLKKQIKLINPEFILALGLTAVNSLMKNKYTMRDIRGQILNYEGKKLLVTYHPAALLRNPQWKKDTWDDVKLLKSMYDEYLENRNK